MTAGLIWALLCLVVMIIFFPGMAGFSKAFAALPFMKINPRFNGGEVAFMETQPACTLVVHRPVFDGLLGDRKKGFVQIDWKGHLPPVISDTIDYDKNGMPDFFVNLDVKSNIAKITSINENVVSLGISTPASFGWILRVNLKRSEIMP